MEQLKALIEKAKSDKELMSKLDALGVKDAGDDKIIALAKEYGFTVTAEDIENLKNDDADSAESNEITEDELEAVAGGTKNRYDPNTCKNMTKCKYECGGFLGLCYCDHYRCKWLRRNWGVGGKKYVDIYRHGCGMNAFPDYEA